MTLPAVRRELFLAAPDNPRLTKARILERSLPSKFQAITDFTADPSPSLNNKRSKGFQITMSQHSNCPTISNDQESPQKTSKLKRKLPHPKRKFSANSWKNEGGKNSPLPSPVEAPPATPINNGPANSVDNNASPHSQATAPAATQNLQNETLQRASSFDPCTLNSSELISKAANTTLVVDSHNSTSRLSSSSSPDSESSADQYSARYSPNGDLADRTSPPGNPSCLSLQTSPPTPAPPYSAPYVNLECLLCSKTHHWGSNDPVKNKKNLQLSPTWSCPRFKKLSRSMGDLIGQLPTSVEDLAPQEHPNHFQHSISRTGTTDNPNSESKRHHHHRSHSSDKTCVTVDKPLSRKGSVPSLATHSITKSCEITPSKNSLMKATNFHNQLHHEKMTSSYESITSNGPYEQVPHGNLPNTILNRQASNNLPRADIKMKLGGGSLHSIQIISQDSQGGYKSIKQSGPYERAHYASDPALVRDMETRSDLISSEDMQKPKPKPRPVPPPRKKKLANHATTIDFTKSPKGNYESILNTANSVVLTLAKKSDSLGDLLDIRDSSEMYPPQTTVSGNPDAHHAPLNLDCRLPIPPNHQDLEQYQHHVLTLHSPEDQSKNSPNNKALPYAVVWLDRT